MKWNSLSNAHADLNKLPISNNSIKNSTSSCIISDHNSFNHLKPKKEKDTYLRAKPIITIENAKTERTLIPDLQHSFTNNRSRSQSQRLYTGLVTRPDWQVPEPGIVWLVGSENWEEHWWYWYLVEQKTV